MNHKHITLALFSVVTLVACKTPEKTADCSRKAVSMSVEEALSVVKDLEASQSRDNASDPLRTPKSLDDVLEILKRDQFDLFPAGVAFATTQGGPQADALQGQIELAWSDSQLILSQLYARSALNLRNALSAMRARGAAESEKADAQKEAVARRTIAVSEHVAEALAVMAAEHAGAGGRLAKAVIARNPEDYQGYRVAADYYRMRQDWAAFDLQVKKIQATNPDSNGLVFLQAAALVQRDGNTAEGVAWFRKALEKDPHFTRAQVQILMAQTDPVEAYKEFQKLKEMNPKHQVVIWAGEAITAAYNAHLAATNRTRP